ncbi:hypothetical protein TNCV_2395841 [Trichonephila clavipes]|nr:hypothetical protein TNCV_2395841 [Trichonephila clavipes]
MESMRLVITRLGYSVPLFQKSSFQFLEICGGGWRPATCLPRASQTCSIGFMSGEHAGHSIRTIPSRKGNPPPGLARCGLQLSSIKMKSSPLLQRRDYNRSEISSSLYRRVVSGPSRMMRGLCFRQRRCHHTPTLPTAKSDTFVHEGRIIIRMNRKTGLIR